MATQSQQLSSNTSQIGAPIPLCYGFHWVTGNLLAMLTQDDGTRLPIYQLGEGEWDGIDKLYINRAEVDFTDTSIVHFHPGTDGVTGTGSTGGDQKGDSFISDLNLDPQLTFSRTAYIALSVAPDPDAPSADLEVVGSYRTTKVRIFDGSGNQIGYAFSTNPAWQTLDVILRVWVKRHSLINAPLLAAERKRFDFASWVDTAAYNDELLNGNIKRFESSVAFVDQKTAADGLDQLLTLGRSYLREVNGVIQLRSDKPRSAAFFLTQQHLDTDTLVRPNKGDLVGAANQFTGKFLDVDGYLATIAPTSTQGLKRVSGVVSCLCLSAPKAAIGDKVGVKLSDSSSFLGDAFVVTARPDLNTVQWSQSGADEISGAGILFNEQLRYAAAAPVLNHEASQNAQGVFGIGLSPSPLQVNLDMDLGNNTIERARRLLYFQKTRSLGIDQIPYRAPWQIDVDAFMESIDAKGNALKDVRPGDIVNIDKSVMDELAGDYEMLPAQQWDFAGLNNQVSKMGSSAGGSASPPMLRMSLKELVLEAFSDTLPEDQDDLELPPPGVFATQFQYANAASMDVTVAGKDWIAGGFGNTHPVIPDPSNIPELVGIPNAAFVSIVAQTGEQVSSRWIRFADYRFVLPAGAVVVGFEARIDSLWSTGITVVRPDDRINDLGVQLFKGGSYVGSDQSQGQWPAVKPFIEGAPEGGVTRLWGGNANAWGVSFVDTDVADASFGFALRVKLESLPSSPSSSAVDIEVSVDAAAMRLFYTV
jgi:hypothetical protein